MTDEDQPDPHSMIARLANFSWRWAGRWLVMYTLNLVLPLHLASWVSDEGGRIGVAIQVATIGLIGLLASGMQYGPAKCVVAGAGATALMQVVVVVHFVAAGIAFGVSGWVFGPPGAPTFGDGLLSEARGALATLLTAAQLMLIAFGVGVGLDRHTRRNDPP